MEHENMLLQTTPATEEWVIEGPLLQLQALSQEEGLPEEAVRPAIFELEAPLNPEAHFVFPDVYCPHPEPWLFVLFKLVQKKIPFQLYQRKKANGRVVTLARIYPKIDEALMKVIAEIAAVKAGRIAYMSNRIEIVFQMLQNR